MKKVGIDLGTTNTVVCYQSGGSYQYLDFGSSNLLQSLVFVAENGKIYVGSRAENLGNNYPTRLIHSSKTHMGESNFVYPDSVPGLDFEIKLTPTDVATEILKEVKNTLCLEEICEEDEEIEAVITVPAYFSASKIEETKLAAERAGLTVKSIFSEPTAAAFAYINEHIENNAEIFVVDFGGGTLDLTLLEYNPKDDTKYIPVLTRGDNKLGGDDIDDCVIKWIVDKVKSKTGVDLNNFKSLNMTQERYLQLMVRIANQAKSAKHKLSEHTEYRVAISNLLTLPNGQSYDFYEVITRNDFDKYCYESIYQRFIQLMTDFFKTKRKCGVHEGEYVDITKISKVLLVGGSCYIPKIREMVESMFQKKAQQTDLSNIVAMGACIIAESNIIPKQQLAYDLGIEVADPNNISRSIFEPIIHNGELVPCKCTKKGYTTVVNNQKQIDINVYERGTDISENDYNLDKCKFYSGFTFTDFKTGAVGEPKIDVTFEFDKDRTLRVSVVDARTGSTITKKISKKKIERSLSNASIAPTDVFLLIDNSGSMSGVRLNKVKFAVKELVTNIIDMNNCRVGIITFSRDYSLVTSLTNDAKYIISKTNKISADTTTYAEEAFKCAKKELSSSGKNREKIIIMLTDGEIFDAKETKIIAQQCNNSNIKIATIGAAQAKMDYLESISSLQGKEKLCYPISDFSQLAEIFRRILNTLKRSNGGN